MYIGICKIKLNIPTSGSLKFKRQIVRSLTAKIRSKFHVAIAEIDDHDLWQTVQIGICTLSNKAQPIQQVLDKILDEIVAHQGDYVLLDHQIEIMVV